MASEKNKKWFHIFTAGTYDFGEGIGEVTITSEELKIIASNYNPEYYEADLHIGHPDFTKEPEPAALGWINELKVEGEKLLCSFSHLSNKAKEYVNDKLYRWCSIEFAKIEGLGRYLVGLGLTNYPRVDDLPELQFSAFNKIAGNITALELFSESKNSIKNIMAKNEIKISEPIEKFATRIGINVSEYNCDGDILDFAATKIEELISSYSGNVDIKSLSMVVEKWKKLPGEIETLTASKTALESELENLKKTTEVEKIVASAIAEGKLLPSQRETFITFGNAAGVDILKQETAKLLKLDVFKTDVIKTAEIEVTEGEPKHDNGSLITFAEYAKAVGSRKAEDLALVAKVKDASKLPGYESVIVLDSKK